MIQVYATAKLRKKLPLNKDGYLRQTTRPIMTGPDVKANPLTGWHAHLLLIQRRQCVLFVHDVSRFTLFIPCLVKQDFESLDWHFQDVLVNCLLTVGINYALVTRATEYLGELCFDHSYDRSVQGTVNQSAADIEHMLWHDRSNVTDLLPYSTSAWLSERPCMIKNQKECIWPIKMMTELLGR